MIHLRNVEYLASLATGGSGSSFGPITTGWAARVVTNGGVRPSNNTLSAADTFWNAMISASLDTSIIALNFIAPDNLIAAQTPYIVGPGLDPWPAITTSFTSGDLTVNGLLGNGTDKALSTGVSPSISCFTNTGDAGLTYYLSNYVSSYIAMGSGRQAPTQCLDVIGDFGSGFGFFFECWGQSGNCPDRVTNAAFGPAFSGYVSSNRTSTSAAASYKANSGTPHAAIASCATPISASSLPTNPIWVIGSNAFPAFAAGRFSFFAIHHGLSSAQSSTFFGLIQALRTSLGGGFT